MIVLLSLIPAKRSSSAQTSFIRPTMTIRPAQFSGTFPWSLLKTRSLIGAAVEVREIDSKTAG